MNEPTAVATYVTGIADQVADHEQRPRAAKVLTTDSAHVVAFGFSAGQTLKEHRAFHPVVIQVVQGHCRFSYEQQVVDLRPGDLIQLPAMMRHAVEAVEESLLLVTMLVSAPGGGDDHEVGRIPDAID